MPYKVIIADDNEQSLGILCGILSEDKQLQVVGRFGNCDDLITACKTLKPDMIFLDIDMPDIGGIKAAECIRTFNSRVNIVFATGFEDYRDKAFKVYATDYITKPYDEERIKETINRIKMLLRSSARPEKDNYIEIDYKGEKTILRISDLCFIEAINRICIFHTVDKSYQCYTTLKIVMKKLNQNFFRSHKSYIINLKKISRTEAVNRSSLNVYFKDSNKIALLSSSYFKEFQNKIHLVEPFITGGKKNDE